MGSTKIITDIRWVRTSKSVGDRLIQVVSMWDKTPYQPGQRAKKIGVDCVRFVSCVLDELYNVEVPTSVPRMQVDAALHSMAVSSKVIRLLRKSWEGSDVVRDGTIQPGDVIVTRAESGNSPARPAHVMIALVEPFTAAHAIPGVGVVVGSVQNTRGIVRVYRLRGKASWASKR